MVTKEADEIDFVISYLTQYAQSLKHCKGVIFLFNEIIKIYFIPRDSLDWPYIICLVNSWLMAPGQHDHSSIPDLWI